MKKWLKEYFSYNQNIIAWVSVILVAIALFFVLFASPRVGVADFGEYDLTLHRMGLARTEADEADAENRYFYKVNEEYEITGVEASRLFGTIPTESMVYPVTLISSVCKLLHMNFNTVYLAVFYCVMVLISIYILAKSLYAILKSRALIVPVLLCICVLSSDNIVPFNSLYSDGMVLSSFLLFLAMSVRGLVSESTKGARNTIPMFITAYLFLTSNVSMPYMIGIVLVFAIYVCCKNKTEKSKIRFHWFVSIAGCLLLLTGCGRFITQNETLNVPMNLYSATFNGAFVAANDKTEALEFFGLPGELQADIGKSYYLAEEDYVVAPYTEEAETVLYSKLSYAKLLGYYISHPDVFVRVLNQNLAASGRMNLERYLYINADGTSNPDVEVERMGYYAFLRKLFVPTSGVIFLIVVVLAFLAVAGLWVYKKRRKQDCSICIYLWMILAAGIGRLFITTFVYGTFENRFQLYSYIALFDVFFVAMLCAGIQAIYSLCVFLNEKEEAAQDEEIEPSYAISSTGPVIVAKKTSKRISKWCNEHVWTKQKWAVLTVSILAAAIMFYVLFLPDRIGAYNNGDFGRMMDAMGLYYNEYDLLHQDEQYVTKITEDYVWLDNFDWTSVTSFNPTMSQVFLAVLIKLTAGAMGMNYSTVYATVIYWILMGLAFAAIVYGLYRALGKKSVLLSCMLIVVCFGSYNLGWFNSLFSEATEMAGFLLVLGMSLLLIVKKRGTVRWYEWFLFLASIRIFIGSKSQVTPEIMVLGIWAIVLAVYHRPKPITSDEAEQAIEETAVEAVEAVDMEETAVEPAQEKEIVKKSVPARKATIKWVLQIVCVVAMVALTARSAIIIYQKDSAISSQDTTFSSIFSGVLMVADDPIVALNELGLDERLVQDVGKNPYLGDGAYYCQPRTEMAEEMIYSKVNTFDVLGWYLKHPDKLLYMLDHAAIESANPMPDYFLYVGEKTTQEHRTVSKFNMWSALRGSLTPNRFWQYFVLYGGIILFCVIKIVRKKSSGVEKLLSGFMIVIVFAGALQFPLSVIGNGFIDNTKQLFMFRFIHDIIFSVVAFTLIIKLRNWLQKSHG